MSKIAIEHVHIHDVMKRQVTMTNCYLDQGKFIAFGQAPQGFVADQVIDASQLWMMPGLVDLSVNLLRKNLNEISYLEHSLAIAKQYGIKTLCQWPVTQPAFDNPMTVQAIINNFHRKGESQLLPIAALTDNLQGETLADLTLLQEAGAIGFSQGDKVITNTNVLLNAFAYAASFDLRVFIKPCEPWLTRPVSIHQGTISALLGLEGMSTEAEILDINRCLVLAKKTGVKLHFSGISSAAGIAMIQQAKETGISVTCDVAIPNLFLTEMDIANFESAYHLNPPLRTLEDQAALLQAIQAGVIDVISSHNRSCSLDAKRNPFAMTPAGYHGFVSFLPLLLMLTEKLSMPFIDILAFATQRCYPLAKMKPATFTVGQLADFILVDPTQEVVQHESPYLSPFTDWRLFGKVVGVCFDGVMRPQM